MNNREIIILTGDDAVLINKHQETLYKEYGDYNFANSIEEMKSMQNWLIVQSESTIIEAFYKLPNINLLIITNYLHEIPSEVRANVQTNDKQVKLFIYNKEINFKSNEEPNLRFWKLNFNKYKPKDLK